MQIQENVPLKQYTTFRIGGPAKYFCIVKTEDELLEAIGFSKKNKIPYFILGGGSNILVSDAGYQGIVIKMEILGITCEELVDNIRIRAGAGENWDNLVAKTVDMGLYGLENMSYIPGTVGAGPVQNIGAYGSEICDTLESVEAIDIKKNEYITLSKAECQFSYRDSLFKKEAGRYVILYVNLILNKKEKLNTNYKDLDEYFKFKNIKEPNLKQVRDAVIDIRTRKLPDVREYGTAGSFFKNIIVSTAKSRELVQKYPDMIVNAVNDKKVKIPLAWILDHVCGFKAVRIGNVGTYKSQALVLVNYGNATAQEVINLARKMVDKVYAETEIGRASCRERV